ncbi:hypothetical protein NDN01_23100 [Sphingomonas sp. QA11]|uniref:hypothetical protein n=1 Tax=Sphingomonas sp. QA11 TaxID=2950605 RepID=UPI00234AB67A|nr:hypothetical protein [Sphingomonas sp. QA11]WCM26846.1 hypothetical protein NDN01_23100 [Sphingomonas sp. QA11]
MNRAQINAFDEYGYPKPTTQAERRAEAALQLYQGQCVNPGYAGYLARLDRMKIPFRIGLLQGGEWRMPVVLEATPHFRGYVVFPLNPR